MNPLQQRTLCTELNGDRLRRLGQRINSASQKFLQLAYGPTFSEAAFTREIRAVLDGSSRPTE